MLKDALALAAQGLPVFPVYWMAAPGVCSCALGASCPPKQRGKHPITPRGHNNASADPTQVSKWWELAPTANIGVAVPDGLCVVDVDPRNGGEATYDKLDAQHGFPDTRWAKTGGGGAHFWYRLPPGFALPSTLSGFGAGDGVDVKQLGGYVLAPPSNHASGGMYEWVSPSDAPIANAPSWLLANVRPRGERAERVVDEDDADERTVDDATLDGIVLELRPHFVDGKKHYICKALGGWLKQQGYTVSDVSYLISALLEPLGINPRGGIDAAKWAFSVDKPFGWHELNELIGPSAAVALEARTPNLRRRREQEDLKTATEILVPAMAASAVTYAASAAACLIPDSLPPGQVPPIPQATPPVTMAPPPLPQGAGLPIIVGDARGSQFWVVRGRDYFSPVAKGMLPARYLEATGGRSEKQKADDLASAATIAEKVVRDFAASSITWQEAERAIVQGYPQPEVMPEYDAAVDAWLHALAGERYGYLAQWFASCTQARITKLAACLVLIGGTGIGKTLIALLAARMWGATSPVALSHAIDRFNSTITKCPIVLDDEAARMKQADVATNDFREMLSARERTFEPKGVDKRELRGCQRFVVTCNAFSDLRFSDVGSLEVVEALADRLLVVQCGPADEVRAALEPLRLPNSDDVDLTRLDRHISWIVASTPVVTARFLASPGRDDPAARQAVLDGLIHRYPDLFDRIRLALERGERAVDHDVPDVFVLHGLVWVRGERADLPRTAQQVYRALSPWEAVPKRDVIRLHGSVIRARAHNLTRLAADLGCTVPVAIEHAPLPGFDFIPPAVPALPPEVSL